MYVNSIPILKNTNFRGEKKLKYEKITTIATHLKETSGPLLASLRALKGSSFHKVTSLHLTMRKAMKMKMFWEKHGALNTLKVKKRQVVRSSN